MHVFHIRGFSGLVLLLLGLLAIIAVFFVLPAAFLMVLWNALVYEGLKGPEISMLQGFMLWGVTAVLIKLIFKPEIQLQFQSASSYKKGGASMKAFQSPVVETKTEEAQPENNVQSIEEAQKARDNQEKSA